MPAWRRGGRRSRWASHGRKSGFRITLSTDGQPVGVTDLREGTGRKLFPQLREVPAAVIRKANILGNTFWDKTAYSLGRTAGEGRRTADEHAAFKAANLRFIEGSNDEGLTAFRRFLETWDPCFFDSAPFRAEMLDTNIVFALQGETRDIHEREAAQRLLAARLGRAAAGQLCLVTGITAAPARLHPTIKGVMGAQTAGASLVSFNLDAFTSYGKAQGDNAPTSEAAAFRYGAALNRMLDRGSRNRLPRPVGDASLVFWADTSLGTSEQQAQDAEDFLRQHDGATGRRDGGCPGPHPVGSVGGRPSRRGRKTWPGRRHPLPCAGLVAQRRPAVRALLAGRHLRRLRATPGRALPGAADRAAAVAGQAALRRALAGPHHGGAGEVREHPAAAGR